MRDIKFRVWDKVDEMMIYPQGKNHELFSFELDADNNTLYFYDSRKQRPGEDYILLQYTGLKDKHGKEIYEGDIVDTDDGKGKIIYDDKYGCFAIEYSNHKIALIDYLIHKHDIFRWLGNIYENPELKEG